MTTVVFTELIAAMAAAKVCTRVVLRGYTALSCADGKREVRVTRSAMHKRTRSTANPRWRIRCISYLHVAIN